MNKACREAQEEVMKERIGWKPPEPFKYEIKQNGFARRKGGYWWRGLLGFVIAVAIFMVIAKCEMGNTIGPKNPPKPTSVPADSRYP